MRAGTVLLAICAGLLLASPASAALTPPELFVRLQRADITHAPAGDWIPLATAPQLNYIGGFQIGYRLQATGVNGNFQTAALAITGVPDGRPTQPSNTPPYCVGRNGAEGTITALGGEIQFEGDGTYSLSVSLGDTIGTGCVGGPATTAASFTVDVHVAPQLVGAPFAYRAKPLPGDPFVGIRAADPAGGYGDNSCALDAGVNADGSVTGRRVVPADAEPPRQTVSSFPEPGTWSCVSRGVVEGVNESSERTIFGTPWSAPLRFEVHSDFRRAGATITGPRKTRPTLDVKAEFPAASANGNATFKLMRFVRCGGSGYVFANVASSKGQFDAKGHAKFRVNRPRKKVGYYAARVAFRGTHFVRAGTDPNLILLVASKRALTFAKPLSYPRC